MSKLLMALFKTGATVAGSQERANITSRLSVFCSRASPILIVLVMVIACFGSCLQPFRVATPGAASSPAR